MPLHKFPLLENLLDIDGRLPTDEGLGHISFMLAIGMFALVSYSRSPIVTRLSPHA
jgi:hypothetical protein